MTIRLLNDMVLVLLVPMPERTEHGVMLAPALPPPSTAGRIVRVGPKVREVHVGDMVAFPPTVGTPMPMDGHECLFLRETEITATIGKYEGQV